MSLQDEYSLASGETPEPWRPEECAFILIDQQRLFTDPLYSNPSYAEQAIKDRANNKQEFVRGTSLTDRVAAHNAGVVEALRGRGVTIAMVYMSKEDRSLPWNVAGGGLHRVVPVANDIVESKSEACAMSSSYLSDRLEERGIKRRIFGGFNASACVLATVMKSAERYDVETIVLADCVANGRDWFASYADDALERMRMYGAKILISRDDLNLLLPKNPQSHSLARTARL